MRYSKIINYDIANGEGIRTTLFVTGCTFHCKGCFNYEIQPFTAGNEWTSKIEDHFIELCKDENIQGISILGGEPMQQDGMMLNLVKRIKREVNKPIWMWSGYKLENLINPCSGDKKFDTRKAILRYVDVLIDGQFEEDKKDMNLIFRGSSNQRVINVQESLSHKQIVLYM